MHSLTHLIFSFVVSALGKLADVLIVESLLLEANVRTRGAAVCVT